MDINQQNFSTTGTARDGNVVTIYTRKVLNNFQSKQQNERVYDFLPFVEIVSPAQKHSVVDRKFEEADQQKYPEHWAAYEKKEQLRSTGTPLADWSGCPAELIPEMEYQSIFTVEDLTNVSDANLAKIGLGMHKVRDAAKLYVAGEGKNEIRLQEALAEIADLKATLDKLVGADEAILEVPEQENQDEPTNDSSRYA